MIKKCINDNWIVTETGLSDDPFAGSGAGERVSLPHDAMITKARVSDLAGGAAQGYFPDSNYCYEKTITYDSACGRCYIEFEGIYNNSMVYVNGNAAGSCRYGYTDYILNITDYLDPGDNKISIEVKPGIGRNTRWYTGNGILRNVFLYEGGQTGFIPGSLKVSTKEISEGNALISAEGKICFAESEAVSVEYEIYHTGENAVGSGTVSVREDGTFSDVITITGPALWTAETPELYRLKVRLVCGGETLDEDETGFGIRTVETIPGKGLLINGVPVKLRGGCIHADNGIAGAAEYDALAYRRIMILKEAGYNAVRIAHHPAAPALLDACDVIGMYVMDESFDTWNVAKTQYDYTLWFEENWRRDLDCLVRKDHNHPSVIMYTIGNEIKELDTRQGIDQNRIMYEYLKQLDPSRPISNAVNGMFTAMGHMGEIMSDILGDDESSGKAAAGVSADINQVMSFLDNNMDDIMCHRYVTEMLDPICENLDIAGYNYMGGRYEHDAEAYPDRIIVGSETRPDSIAENWEKVSRLPNVIGDFVWTAWDYIGEAGIGRTDHEDLNGPMYGRYPWMLSCTGDIDILGFRRPQSYYREIVWGLRSDPYITAGRFPDYGKPARTSNWSWAEVVRSWTWKGFEGETAHIDVYSDAEEVELILNDRVIGRAAVGAHCPYTAEFDIPYEEGELRAVSYINGIKTGADSLRTASEDRALSVNAEKGRIKGSSDEILILDIAVCDKNGEVDYLYCPEVKIQMSGSAELIGFGSADPKTEESYISEVHRVFDGHLQAILRVSCCDTDTWSATISCDGFDDVVIGNQ